MREQLQRRLAELKAEFETGQKVLAELEQKRATLEQTLLRISGAIQVLEEELSKAGQMAENGDGPDLSVAGKNVEQMTSEAPPQTS